MIDDVLSSALRRATEALASDDVIAAAAALQEAARACEQARHQGIRLEPAQVCAVQSLHASCSSAIETTRQRLTVALGAMGQARRAVGAYRLLPEGACHGSRSA